MQSGAIPPVTGAMSLRKRRWGAPAVKEAVARSVCFACAAISILTTLGIVLVLLRESLHFFQRVSVIEFFTGTEWSPTIKPESYGVLPLLAGTFQIAVGSAIVAIPLGLLAAVYLSEYASGRLRAILKPALELLAGVPTVVYGYFAVFFVTPLLRSIWPEVEVFNGAAGAIVVGIMILPLVTSLSEDAISSVPRSLREAAYGLGSTKREVILKVVVPAALSGIVASFILAISRAVGETMAVTLAAGAKPNLTLNPAEGVQTMTAFIVQISQGETPAGTTPYYTLFAVGITLFAITLVMNLAAAWLVRRFRQVYH